MAQTKNGTSKSKQVQITVKNKPFSYVYLLIGFLGGMILTTLYFLYVSGANPVPAITDPYANFPEIGDVKTSALTQENMIQIREEIEVHMKEAISSGMITEASLIFEDLNTRLTFTVNPGFTFSPSSLMKVPVMMAVVDKAKSFPLYLKERIVYRGSMEMVIKQVAVEKVETSMTEGSDYSVEELLEMMICDSDNEATYLLLESIGLEEVQKMEQKVGFVKPEVKYYYDSFTTVEKFIVFFDALYSKELLGEEMSNYGLDLLARAKWNYGIRKAVPPSILVHHKYGLNSYPCSPVKECVNQVHNFAIINIPGNPVILGIATGGTSELDMMKYIEVSASIVFGKLTSSIGFYKRPKRRIV